MAVVLWGAIVTSLLGLVCAHSINSCGTSSRPLITGGKEIVHGEYPWLAALYKENESHRWAQFCGGALLTRSIVLTAAHCLVNDEVKVMKPDNVKVGLGKLYREFYHQEDNGTIADVTQIVLHNSFQGAKSNYALDVGLLKLKIFVRMSAYVLSVCFDLDKITTVTNGASVHVVGWGTTENGTSTDRALAATLSYLDYNSCLNRVNRAYRKFITHDKICSLSINGSEVDRGDSGGTLTHVKNNRHFVIGVVSTKIIGRTVISVFTDLSNPDIQGWIKQQTDAMEAGSDLIFPNTVYDINPVKDYNEGHLILYTLQKLYTVPVGSSKEMVSTEVDVPMSSQRPAVDCVTGLIYWTVNFQRIRQGTLNGTNVKDFIAVKGSYYGQTLDWIGRRLYMIYSGSEEITSLISVSLNNTENSETIITNISSSAKLPVVHPTLRKIYLIVYNNEVHSIDLDSSTPTLTAFHEERFKNLEDIAIDWQTNDLCWLTGTFQTSTIECKNLVTEARRTIVSDYPKIRALKVPLKSQGLVITPYNYYWKGHVHISRMSRYSSKVDDFTVNNTVGFPKDRIIYGITLLPATCPDITPAPSSHQI